MFDATKFWIVCYVVVATGISSFDKKSKAFSETIPANLCLCHIGTAVSQCHPAAVKAGKTWSWLLRFCAWVGVCLCVCGCERVFSFSNTIYIYFWTLYLLYKLEFGVCNSLSKHSCITDAIYALSLCIITIEHFQFFLT